MDMIQALNMLTKWAEKESFELKAVKGFCTSDHAAQFIILCDSESQAFTAHAFVADYPQDQPHCWREHGNYFPYAHGNYAFSAAIADFRQRDITLYEPIKG